MKTRLTENRPAIQPTPRLIRPTFAGRQEPMARGFRKNISIPGLLAPTLHLRMSEFGHRTVSPFAVDLVCYDLRSNAAHTITLAISRDAKAAQDAVDAELVARYRPRQPRNGLLVEIVEHLAELRRVARYAVPPMPLSAKPARITFPADIWPLANLRWKELGYASLSAYVTGLIRYDLLIGGPHLFNARDTRREILAALDRETLATRERGKPRKLFLDYLIERVQGRPLTTDELDKRKAQVARQLLRHVAIHGDRNARGSAKSQRPTERGSSSDS